MTSIAGETFLEQAARPTFYGTALTRRRPRYFIDRWIFGSSEVARRSCDSAVTLRSFPRAIDACMRAYVTLRPQAPALGMSKLPPGKPDAGQHRKPKGQSAQQESPGQRRFDRYAKEAQHANR